MLRSEHFHNKSDPTTQCRARKPFTVDAALSVDCIFPRTRANAAEVVMERQDKMSRVIVLASP